MVTDLFLYFLDFKSSEKYVGLRMMCFLYIYLSFWVEWGEEKVLSKKLYDDKFILVITLK